MCRFLVRYQISQVKSLKAPNSQQVYKGKDEILLSKLILEPQHSILTQSYDSRLRLVNPLPSCQTCLKLPANLPSSQDTRRPHNGDGFGIGYYTPPALGPEPCIFTSTIPAWNCINLERLASKTTSSLIFAHVRATTEGSLSDSNCHPFRHGALMWMHNGNIGGWKYVKRALALSIEAEWFNGVQGSTDSEWAFALFLNSMREDGTDPDEELGQKHGFGHVVLRKAILRTIKRINQMIAEIPDEYREREGLDTRSLLNFAVTDGHSVICTRYVSSATDEAASLYFSSGTSWKQEGAKGSYKMERRDKGADIVLVASEPLTFERGILSELS
jgi:glutamine amidotransferase